MKRLLYLICLLAIPTSCASIKHIHLPVPELQENKHFQAAFDFSDAGEMIFLQAGKTGLRGHIRIQQGMVDYFPGERAFKWRTLRDTGAAIFRYVELGGAYRLQPISNSKSNYELICAISMQEGSAPIQQFPNSRHFHRSNSIYFGLQQIRVTGYLSTTTQYRGLTFGLQHYIGLRERRLVQNEMHFFQQGGQLIPVIGFSEAKETRIYKNIYSQTYASVVIPLVPSLWSWNKPASYALIRYNPFVFGSGIYWKF